MCRSRALIFFFMEPTAAVGGSEGQPGSPPAGDSPPVSPTRQDRKKQSSIGRRLRDLFRTSSHDEGQAPAAAAATAAAAGGDQTGFGPLDSRLVSPARSSGGALFSRSRPGSMRGTETTRQQRSASLRATIALDSESDERPAGVAGSPGGGAPGSLPPGAGGAMYALHRVCWPAGNGRPWRGPAPMHVVGLVPPCPSIITQPLPPAPATQRCCRIWMATIP